MYVLCLFYISVLSGFMGIEVSIRGTEKELAQACCDLAEVYTMIFMLAFFPAPQTQTTFTCISIKPLGAAHAGPSHQTEHFPPSSGLHQERRERSFLKLKSVALDIFPRAKLN